jgi:hypothetical protein
MTALFRDGMTVVEARGVLHSLAGELNVSGLLPMLVEQASYYEKKGKRS